MTRMKKSVRVSHAISEWRFIVIKGIFILFGAVIISRLFSLQITKHKEYVEVAQRQQGVSVTLLSKRGTIFFQDKNGNHAIAAINKEWPLIAISPQKIKNPERVRELLTAELGIQKDVIERLILKQNDPFEIVARKVDEKKADRIMGAVEKEKIEGIIVSQEFRRYYPGGNLGSAILGFVNFENDRERGQYGIERQYNKELSGEGSIFPQTEKSIVDGLILLGKKIVKPREYGDSLVLTIDHNVQYNAEKELKKVVEKWKAASGSFLVLDPMTGKILAMGAFPSFDLNAYSKEKDLSVFKNPIIDSQFELGSIMKPLTMASGVEDGVVGPHTTYTDTGEVAIGSFRIKNYDLRAHGVQTMTQVLEKSLNTGAIFVQRLVGKNRFFEYIQKFGFGEKTGIVFPNEARGNISNLLDKRDSDYATASFGQGISMTPLQIAIVVSAIANGGNLVEPYLVEKIFDDSGNEIITQPKVLRRVISKETSEIVSRMLVSVVENGFENHAGVSGYFVAGKTGTAQVPYKDRRGYDPDRAIHSFIGYAPAFKPKFLVFLQLNEPQGIRFASSSLTPTFHAIAKYMLNYYEVPVDIIDKNSKVFQ
ncbi:MAG: penicillin-binding protein 2 [Patescibacteria group bacterium]